MASKYWIKLYHEILDDPKMGRMPDRLWRRTIELFLIAGEVDQEGLLPTIEDTAYRLRIDDIDLEGDLIELEKKGIVYKDGDSFTVAKFVDRQGPMSSAERVRRYRDAQRSEEYNDTHYINEQSGNEVSNDNVTNRSQIRLDKIRKDKSRSDETTEKQLISSFCEVTGIPLPSNTSTYAKWITEVGDWLSLGVDTKTIQQAYSLAIEKDYTVARPGGLTSFIRGEIAKQNSSGTAKKTVYFGPDGEKMEI